MPSLEQEQSRERPDSQPEREALPYYQASRFTNEHMAGRAYFRAQRAIFDSPECDLSVFRFQLARIYHVAVLGQLPLPDLERRLSNILSAGIPTTVAPEILTMLQERRAQATELGPWVEGHYRPGRHL